jgi:hypothetical protein
MHAWDTILTKGLKFGDDPFYEAAYEGRLNELKKLDKINKTTTLKDAIDEDAAKTALDKIFLNDSNLSELAIDMRRVLNQKTANVAGNTLIPFAKTPYNYIDKAAEYGGVGAFKALNELRKAIKKPLDQKKFVDSLARTTMGAGAFAGGLYGGKKLLTGDYEKNKEKRLYDTSVKGETDHQLKLPGGVNLDYKDFPGVLVPLAEAAEYNKSKDLCCLSTASLDILLLRIVSYLPSPISFRPAIFNIIFFRYR